MRLALAQLGLYSSSNVAADCQAIHGCVGRGGQTALRLLLGRRMRVPSLQAEQMGGRRWN